jgi:hypothetical protein
LVVAGCWRTGSSEKFESEVMEAMEFRLEEAYFGPDRSRRISVLDRIGDSCFNNRHYGND